MDEKLEQELILRFSLATFLESVRLVDEGIASPEDVDIAMRAGAGIKIGPLMWADSRGLDQVLKDLEGLAATVGPRFQPPDSLRRHVERGQLGVKTGQGYLVHVNARAGGNS
ncbi:3-hydroxyacyl-CoA dehydrogenase family protein [Sulfobacillus harzensis]|uniref:3-hydroxyacyl-CoA dehydrogenase n=1 Tax=Sulfobacillus harzensis TaxID=2729629 RepID=A0A7Y0Q2X9_9FIRM|nr:3-hydroxyacyl-CoA dehydrogenase family protein [Sulfobacillus harzensis]NMP23628.1 3-hydroxyacyl-CoA dehydrogenase [Sulfobacillus harzensis]